MASAFFGRCLRHYPQTKHSSLVQASQSITGNAYSSIPWDMWTKMTMNKGSKLKAGWLSILPKEKQLMTDIRNANNLDRIQAAVHNQVNRMQLSQTHTKCAPTRMRK